MSYFFCKFESEYLNKAYELLDDVTPLKFDCGKLCGGKCCKGSDSDGMLLFPGEKEIYEKLPGFTVYYDERYSDFAVSCKGFCDRKNRPLSCRIFPYLFYISDESNNGKISVAPDIRALEFCSILTEKYSINPDFLRKMRMIARLFETDSETVEFIRKLTEDITDCGGLL